MKLLRQLHTTLTVKSYPSQATAYKEWHLHFKADSYKLQFKDHIYAAKTLK